MAPDRFNRPPVLPPSIRPPPACLTPSPTTTLHITCANPAIRHPHGAAYRQGLEIRARPNVDCGSEPSRPRARTSRSPADLLSRSRHHKAQVASTPSLRANVAPTSRPLSRVTRAGLLRHITAPGLFTPRRPRRRSRHCLSTTRGARPTPGPLSSLCRLFARITPPQSP